MSRPDKRYGTHRWKQVRVAYCTATCGLAFVPGCPVSASVADHIIEMHEGMPNSLFFDEMNLGGSCRRHNAARGVAARLERELSGSVEAVDASPRHPLVTGPPLESCAAAGCPGPRSNP